MRSISVRGQIVIASLLVAMCAAAIAFDCAGGEAEGRLHEAQKLCGPTINDRCTSLALQPGRLYHEDRPRVLEAVAVLRARLGTAHGSAAPVVDPAVQVARSGVSLEP
jgi:hypothetical protein